MNDTINAPLRENEHVKELLSIMESNQMDTGDLRGLLGYVGAMERQLDAAVVELQAMRQELSDMREDQNHPVRKALQNAVRTLERSVGEAQKKLNVIKESIINGCKSAVSAFKEKGISALSHIAGFFKIKNSLESLRNSLNNGIDADKSAIAKIEAVSAEFHQAGTHVKNMGRAMLGKETVQDIKPAGKLAKALEAPFRSELSCLANAKKSVESAIGKLEQLEQAGMKTRAAEKKPSVLENLQAMKEQAAQMKRDAPVTGKQKQTEASL